MKIEKPFGVNESEKSLGLLCDRTFLKLWTYLNIQKSDGDELCDAIAVFENHIFIFFDRNKNTFKNNSNKSTDILWKRWKKDAIDKQIKTANYAEKYILKNREKLFLDPKCKVKLPIDMPKGEVCIHKIILAHGASQAAMNLHNSPNGSLMICYQDDEYKTAEPFLITLNRKDRIHVLDSGNIEIIFNHLDTFADFKEYIVAKETAISRYNQLAYYGEENLLGHYYLNYDENTKKRFIGATSEHKTIIINEGHWDEFTSNKAYQIASQERRKYLMWDMFIDIISECQLDGTSIGNFKLSDTKSPIYEMAKEPRFVRTDFSKTILDRIDKFPSDARNNEHVKFKTYLTCDDLSKMYVFIQCNRVNSLEQDINEMNEYLEKICLTLKAAKPELKTIIGLSIFSPKYYQRDYITFYAIHDEDWDKSIEKDILELNKKGEYVNVEKLSNIHLSESLLYEFPAS